MERITKIFKLIESLKAYLHWQGKTLSRESINRKINTFLKKDCPKDGKKLVEKREVEKRREKKS